MRPSVSARSSTRGFTLLEAMLAFAVLGMVLVVTYKQSIRLMRFQTEAQLEYELAAMARGLLDEYVLTYPEMPRTGAYKDTWEWQIKEAPQEALLRTKYDPHFQFVRVTVQVARRGKERRPYELFTVVTRRAPKP